MKLVFNKSIMKKAIEACKQVTKDKENSLVWFLTAGKEKRDLFLYTNRNNQEVKYFHNMKLAEPFEEEISFLVNPYLLEEALKGKDDKTEWVISESKEEMTCGAQKIAIRWYKGKFPIGKMHFKTMNDPENFLETLTMMNKVAGKSVADFTIGGGEVTVRSPIYIKRFSFGEPEMPTCTVRPDALTLLNSGIIWRKSDQKSLSYFGDHKELVIKLETTPMKKVKKENVLMEEETIKQLYILQNQNDLNKVKQLEGEVVHTFTVNPDEVLEALRGYKKPVDNVYLYDWEGKLCIDPYDKASEMALNPEEVSLLDSQVVNEDYTEEEAEDMDEYEEDVESLDDEEFDEEEAPKVKKTKKQEEEEEQPIHFLRYQGNVKRTKVDLEGAIAFFEGFSDKTEEEKTNDEYRIAISKIENYEVRETNLLDALKSYGGTVKTVTMYVSEEELLFDPYHKKRKDDQPIQPHEPQIFRFPYQGKTKMLKVDVEQMIQLIEQQQIERLKTEFEPKANALDVEIRRFEEDDEEYYYLTSRSSLFYSILLAKKEPNYVKVQKKVDEIFEEQKKIAYLQ